MNGLVKERGGGSRRGMPPIGRWRERISGSMPYGMFPKNAERSKPLMGASRSIDLILHAVHSSLPPIPPYHPEKEVQLCDSPGSPSPSF